MTTKNNILIIACLLAALAVGLGAFGAHGLKVAITEKQINTFDTGVRYHFYHTFAIFISALLFDPQKPTFFKYAYYLFGIGILCFSGSLYAFTFLHYFQQEIWTWLGPITPLGGLCFIIGWILLAIGIYSTTSETN